MTNFNENPMLQEWIDQILTWSERMEEVNGEVDAIARRDFFEEYELDSWCETDELSSVIATVMAVDSRCTSSKIFWDTVIFMVGDVEVRYTSPCERFPEGCIHAVRNNCWIGEYYDLTEGYDDCGLNTDELSVLMWNTIKEYYEKDLDKVVRDVVADYDSYGPGTFKVSCSDYGIRVPYVLLNKELEDVFNSFRVEYDEKTGCATAVTIFETETRKHF